MLKISRNQEYTQFRKIKSNKNIRITNLVELRKIEYQYTNYHIHFRKSSIVRKKSTATWS